jgi:hypothetical protein
MSTTITIRDESPGQTSLREWSLAVLTERMTVREVLRSRIYQEVQDFNQRRAREDEPVDWRRQFDRAVAAFESKQIVILIDDRQAESLDQELVIQPGTTVTFLKLALLVGG